MITKDIIQFNISGLVLVKGFLSLIDSKKIMIKVLLFWMNYPFKYVQQDNKCIGQACLHIMVYSY